MGIIFFMSNTVIKATKTPAVIKYTKIFVKSQEGSICYGNPKFTFIKRSMFFTYNQQTKPVKVFASSKQELCEDYQHQSYICIPNKELIALIKCPNKILKKLLKIAINDNKLEEFLKMTWKNSDILFQLRATDIDTL